MEFIVNIIIILSIVGNIIYFLAKANGVFPEKIRNNILGRFDMYTAIAFFIFLLAILILMATDK
jgi:small neutral amino acid transporter SnatA (MarC family)